MKRTWYNKATTELLIKRILIDRHHKDGKHALMIIDIDNFKNINDRLGHLYGDTVLSDLADKLKQIFRSDDIIGRIGGDEFFVFLKNYNNIALVKSKTEEMCEIFRNTYTVNDVTIKISASIGISLCPEHGMDLDMLYRNADIALYISKEKGKNSFTIYDGISTANYQSARTVIEGGEK